MDSQKFIRLTSKMFPLDRFPKRGMYEDCYRIQMFIGVEFLGSVWGFSNIDERLWYEANPQLVMRYKNYIERFFDEGWSCRRSCFWSFEVCVFSFHPTRLIPYDHYNSRNELLPLPPQYRSLSSREENKQINIYQYPHINIQLSSNLIFTIFYIMCSFFFS